MFRRKIAAAALALCALPALAAPQKYAIDPNHTYVTFSYDHFGFSHPVLSLGKISGELELDTGDLTRSSVRVTLPLSGLHTGVPKLDEDLRSPNFLDAQKYPDITFRSTKVEKAGAHGLKVSGVLTAHGVSRPVVLAVKINKIAENPMSHVPSAGFEARTTLKRSEFGVARLVPGVSDELEVRISLDSHLADGKK